MSKVSVVKTNVANYTGTVVGVLFRNGVGETSDPRALAYFKRRGYQITPKGAKDGDGVSEPSEQGTGADTPGGLSQGAEDTTESSGDPSNEGEDSLEDLTVADLILMAGEKGIEVKGRPLKGELIELIRNHSEG